MGRRQEEAEGLRRQPLASLELQLLGIMMDSFSYWHG